jgi:hypothetical protein
MSRTQHRRRPRSTDPLLLLALVLLAACGGGEPRPLPEKPAPGGGAGAPLATLHGQVLAVEANYIPLPTRLALAWYPGLLAQDGAPSAPASIVTSSVELPGMAPADYAFTVEQAPPDAALVALGGGLQGRGAAGVLLAYRDLNVNGRLDTIPATGGAPVDRVRGASLVWTSSPAYVVLYLDSEQAPATGLKKGLNLVRLDSNLSSEVVPLSTRIPLPLRDDPMLDVMVCEEAWDATPERSPCGLLDEGEVHGPLSLSGGVSFTGTRMDVSLAVHRDDAPYASAQVSVAGRPAQRDAATGRYVASLEDASAVLAAGSVVVRATDADGGWEVAHTLQLPAPFALTSPAPGAPLSPGTPVQVEYTASAGAQAYRVSLVAADGRVLASQETGQLGARLFPDVYTGPAVLRVEVEASPADAPSLGARRVVERAVAFAPCDTRTAGSRLTVDGSFGQYDPEELGQEVSELNVRVFDGEAEVTDAEVRLSDTRIEYDPEAEAYRESIFGLFGPVLGETVELRVRRGTEELCRTLTLPSDFFIRLDTPEGNRRGSPLKVSWSTSWVEHPVPTTYELLLGPSFHDAVHSGGTNELGFTFGAVNAVGELQLRVAKVRLAPHSGTLGPVEVKRFRTGGVTFVE